VSYDKRLGDKDRFSGIAYQTPGFKIVDENEQEFIMIHDLGGIESV
jgi:hypothetical protein